MYNDFILPAILHDCWYVIVQINPFFFFTNSLQVTAVFGIVGFSISW